MSLSAAWDTVNQPSSIGFLDTLPYDIVSSDPNMSWVSDFGRTTEVAAPPTSVPEPDTLLLLCVGLGSVASLARSGRARRLDEQS